MEQILKKYINGQIRDEIFLSFTKNYNILKERSNQFADIIKDGNITINSKFFDLFYDFIFSYDKIRMSIKTNEFIDELNEFASDNELYFWNSVIEYFDFIDIVKEKTNFLADMDFSSFQDVVSYTFNNNILHNNFVKEYKSWDKEQVRTVQKTINTVLSSMIGDFYDYKTTTHDFKMKFGFEEEKYKYIWDLCEKNKVYLMLKNITEKLDKNNS